MFTRRQFLSAHCGGAGLLLAGLCITATARAQLTIELTVPESTPAGATVHVAGTFNGWNPGDPAYALADQGNDLWTITFPGSVRGFIQFKFTLGSWETVEQNAQGFDVPNRTFTIPATGSITYTGSVATWRNVNVWPLPNSTATPGVSILDFEFAMPQLNRTRRIWIYVPPDYDTTSKRYPVLYMQDGQNVFDTATSFAGEWEVDEALDELHLQGHWGAIVVAVANGEGNRADEYHPWVSAFGGGQGDLYLDFLVDTLKPFIDANYRTLTNPRNTGIGGSSSAAVISFYGAMREPGVFGRSMPFSPAFFVNPELSDFAAATTPQTPPQRFALVSGQNEPVGGLPPGIFADSQLAMVETLAAAGYDTASHVRSLVFADGAHAEWFWRREFPDAFGFLFPNTDTDADGVPGFADNCIDVANAGQRDTGDDGFGNICDPDLNDDGVVNFADLLAMKAAFFSTPGAPTWNEHADLNGDNVVAFVDLQIMKSLFFGEPGPSGIAP